MSPHTIVFIGPQGSGKGTQLSLLKEILPSREERVVHYDAGLALRELVASKTYTGEIVHELMQSGELVPDFCITSLLFSTFNELVEKDSHLVIDGFPRSVSQAEVLDKFLDFYGRKQVDVVLLSLSKNRSVERLLLRGRADDTAEAIENRLFLFQEKTRPVLDYFKGKDKYRTHDINGEQSVEEVHRDVLKSLRLKP